MGIFELNNKTKDGRKWVYKVYYLDLQGNRKQYMSKKYLTKKEAQENERLFLMNIKGVESKTLTFRELYFDYYNFQKSRVKQTTLSTYNKRFNQIEQLKDIKLKDFSIQHYNQWKSGLNKKNITTAYKNTIYKFLRSLLTYATKYHEFEFNKLLMMIDGFSNPDEIKKEMKFWDYEEFSKFIIVEEDITYKSFFEMLYYCGLRLGEAKALNWNDINFEDKTVNINKSLSSKIKGERYVISTTKTKGSVRTLPIPDNLCNDLKTLLELSKSFYGFNKNYFVFGGAFPLADTTIQVRKDKNCELAKVKRIRIHDFRHSTASLLINSGANIVLVAKYLGHARIDMTLNTYSHLYKNQMQDIVNLINKL